MKIAILLYEGFTALDAIGPYEILSRLPNAQLSFVAEEKGAVTTDTNKLALVASKSLTELTEPDLLLVPGGMQGTLDAAENPAIQKWVQHAHQHSRWTTSVCTGSLILGAAGVLEGLEATTHWYSRTWLDQYGATYAPQRYIRQGKVVTAAGVSAGIDMALWLVSELAGKQVAKTVQLAIEYDPAPPFDSGSFLTASTITKRLATAGLALQIGLERSKARLGIQRQDYDHLVTDTDLELMDASPHPSVQTQSASTVLQATVPIDPADRGDA